MVKVKIKSKNEIVEIRNYQRDLYEFQEEMRHNRTRPVAMRRKILVPLWERLFGEPPHSMVSNEALYLKLGYELQALAQDGMMSEEVAARVLALDARIEREKKDRTAREKYEIPFAPVLDMSQIVNKARHSSRPENSPDRSRAMAKKANAETVREGGRPVGKTTGLGVTAAWVHIFERNAKVKKSDRLTDDQITQFMKSEFPGRDSLVFGRVSSVRSKYNKGGLTQGTVPAIASVGYDETGTPLERGAKPTPSATKLVEKKIKKALPTTKTKVKVRAKAKRVATAENA